MKKIFTIASVLFSLSVCAQDNITLPTAKFITGDNTQYKEAGFNDAAWATINANAVWEEQGYPDYNGYAWYRFHFTLPSSLKKKSFWKDSLRILVGKVDDVDETFLNGVKIGQTGSLPTDAGGYGGEYQVSRDYHIATNDKALNWDKENVIAVRVYDGGGGGGMYSGIPIITMMDIIDGVSVNAETGDNEAEITVSNTLKQPVPGMLKIQARDGDADKVISTSSQSISIGALQSYSKKIAIPQGKRIEVFASFTEKNTGKTKSVSVVTKYILTPPPTATPKINGAKVVGVRPGSPFLYKIAATGQKPLQYAATNLPAGLQLDAATGVISGVLPTQGNHEVQLTVTNSLGKDVRILTIKAGNLLALTPPMGWNSWNCWGLSVSEEKVKSSAQALIDKGLIDHGWTYMNIDDG